MAENNFVNLFNSSYNVINGMKKKDLVDNIENLKGKIVIGNDMQRFRSSHRWCSVRKGVLRNFAKFIGKRLCQSLFFNKV